MKPKRKARGIVVTVQPRENCSGLIDVRWPRGGTVAERSETLVCERPLRRAGCPRLKPGEVKKVRVVIEEVK